MIKSTTVHIDEEYGRLKKRVRKCDNQLSEVTKAINITQLQLTESKANFTETLTNLQRINNESQVQLSGEIQGTGIHVPLFND